MTDRQQIVDLLLSVMPESTRRSFEQNLEKISPQNNLPDDAYLNLKYLAIQYFSAGLFTAMDETE